VVDRTDPRIALTAQACERAVVELASEPPTSQVTVADLADRAGVTRATFYSHYGSSWSCSSKCFPPTRSALPTSKRVVGPRAGARPRKAAPLDRRRHRSHRTLPPPVPARRARRGRLRVYEALVGHFTDHALAFLSRVPTPIYLTPTVPWWPNSWHRGSRGPPRHG
jgi:Bacterial regulatory proteins, tetR family